MHPSRAPLDRLTDRFPTTEELPTPARAFAFWLAVGLPLLYVPLLWSGLSDGEVPLFLALVVANVAALVVGHDYKN